MPKPKPDEEVTSTPPRQENLSVDEIGGMVRGLRRLSIIDLRAANADIQDALVSVSGQLAGLWQRLHETKERGPVEEWSELERWGFDLVILRCIRAGVDHLDKIFDGQDTEERRATLFALASALEAVVEKTTHMPASVKSGQETIDSAQGPSESLLIDE
jgi:hypothetical protein